MKETPAFEPAFLVGVAQSPQLSRLRAIPLLARETGAIAQIEREWRVAGFW
jgi:hypothetical protein